MDFNELTTILGAVVFIKRPAPGTGKQWTITGLSVQLQQKKNASAK